MKPIDKKHGKVGHLTQIRTIYPCAACQKQGYLSHQAHRIHIESNTMRTIWLTLALVLLPSISRADVVFSVTSATNFNVDFTASSTGFTNTVGQSFRNTAPSGNVESVTFRLSYVNTAFTGGSLTIGIYNVAGTSFGWQPDGSVLATSQVINASSLTDSALDYTFSGFSAATLNNSSTYIAVLRSSGLTGGGTLRVAGYDPRPSGVYNEFNSSTNGGPSLTQQLYGVITVPEPGTLLLGSIAAPCGGGGAWWRRKRQKASQVAAIETKS